MNIVELAREAGCSSDDPSDLLTIGNLTRFSALVRAEALEEVADMVGACDPRATPKGIAAAIRALKEKT